MINKNEIQKAFIDMLREGYVLTEEEIKATFGPRNANRWVEKIKERTRLDIMKGKLCGEEVVYYMVSEIKPECPGFNEMSSLVEYQIDEEVHAYVEYQKGYYLMWTCPAMLYGNHGTDCMTGESGEECGQYHKVDLGDEPLTEERVAQCIKCGKQYTIAPPPKKISKLEH